MRPIRVAYLNLNPGAHGEYGALLAAAVAEQGDDVEVMSIVPEALAASDRALVSLRKVQCETVRLARGPRRLAVLWRSFRLLRAFRPDVIHDPIGSGMGEILPLRPFLPWLAPLIVTEHNPENHPGMSGWHHGFARALTRRSAARIHVHGPNAHAEMRALGVSDDRLVTIRHGAFDEYGEAARAFSRGTGGQRILVFGALRPNKGIDMLPEIFRRVRARFPEAILQIKGKRPKALAPVQGAMLDAALAELATMPGVELENASVPDADIPQLFGECMICLLPYRSATQSGVAMIAMATEAPVVATQVGDIPDIIKDGRTGLLAEPTPDSIAARIIEALDDPERTAARAREAARFAREHCAWPVIGAQMREVYRDLVAARKSDAQR